MPDRDPFHAWAIVELFGHTRIAGLVSEEQIGGATFIRVDIPNDQDTRRTTRYLGPSAIYSITPVEELIARRLAESIRYRPVQPYELPERTVEAIPFGDDREEDDE